MSLIDRDVILRQIRLLQQLLARVRKAQSQKDFDSALEQIRNGYRESLGLPHELLARLELDSALLMLRTKERQQVYKELLSAEAETLRGQGDSGAAQILETRAARVAQRLA